MLKTTNKISFALLTFFFLAGSIAAQSFDSHCCDDETTHSEILERSAGTCSEGHHSATCTCDQSPSKLPENVLFVVPDTCHVKLQYYNTVSPSLQLPVLLAQRRESITRLNRERNLLPSLPIHISSTILRV